MNLIWKKLSNDKVVDLIPYIKECLTKNPESEIFVGCDSQNRKHFTNFGAVIVLHHQSRGGHVLYAYFEVPRIKDQFTRLFKEVETSLEIAEYLRSQDIPKIDYLDIDLNPDPQFGSNFVLRTAVGYVESMGYESRVKPFAAAATYAADRVCK